MRGHEHDESTHDLRPRGDRVAADVEPLSGVEFAAAAAGRRDVLGPAGMLGLQRAVGNAATAGLVEERSPVHDVVNSGGGSPLPTDLRCDMESRFGQDFGSVRVHTGDAAHASATSVNAQAYTVGENIVFQRDRYDPTSPRGQHMLAHELTHVVQQRSGPVDGSDAGGGVRVSHPSDRFEREAVANADRLMAAPAPAAPAVQRAEPGTEEAPEEETAQTYVQREAAPEEDEETPA
ncbi:eCIS core domain-containing protein [Rhizomonospora bruguierae]|uniref:eCIS core domain-containing protein n=1 Tax=Rhizomonospora bruguierae TaxID=1581705 RepID=UPI001BCDE93A|nr:DUF4157 domain-containing protein [Micromonospora sp. NBRC 107566]